VTLLRPVQSELTVDGEGRKRGGDSGSTADTGGLAAAADAGARGQQLSGGDDGGRGGRRQLLVEEITEVLAGVQHERAEQIDEVDEGEVTGLDDGRRLSADAASRRRRRSGNRVPT